MLKVKKTRINGRETPLGSPPKLIVIDDHGKCHRLQTIKPNATAVGDQRQTVNASTQLPSATTKAMWK